MGVKYIPDAETLAKIKEIAEDGGTQSQISALIQKDRCCVKRLLKEYHIQLKPSVRNKTGRKYEWSRIRINKLKELYASDQYSLDDIAEYFDTSKGTVLRYAKTLGLKKVPVAQFREEDLRYLRENAGKKTLAEMAKDLGRKDDWSIGKQLTRMGIAVRKGTRILRPDTEEFRSDLANPMYSNAALGRKYSIDSSVIRNWRIKDFGSYKRMTDTFLCKSTAEMGFEDILIELHLAYIYEQKIDKWKVDYDLGFNLLVEVQGSHWHDEVQKTIEKDVRKKSELNAKGYVVLEIWDYELENKDAVKKKLLSALKKCIRKYFTKVS